MAGSYWLHRHLTSPWFGTGLPPLLALWLGRSIIIPAMDHGRAGCCPAVIASVNRSFLVEVMARRCGS